jgi:superfamily II DNA or RNA helicase
MQPRPYQLEAVNAVFEQWKTVPRTLGVAPTGSGKTNIACEIIKRLLPGRVIFLAHRTELIAQAKDRLAAFGIEAEIEQGMLYASGSLWGESRVIVATPQTLFASQDKRLKRFNPWDFACLIIDEVHHYCAEAFKRTLTHFLQNPNLKVLGLTATADRADGEALSQIMDSVAFNIEINSLIDDGWLVPIEQQMVKIKSLDFSHCRVTAGELNGADLEAVMREERNLLGIGAASVEVVGNKRAIVFCVNVNQAERMAEIFNRHKPNSADWIYDGTPKKDRKEKLDRFANGEIQIMVNCMVLTEGYDNPGIEVVVMARPTLSRSLYAQMIGRGMRALPGVLHEGLIASEDRKDAILKSTKPKLLVLDFVGNSGRHKLITTADILGGKISEEARERAIKAIAESGTAINVTEAMLEAEAALRREIEERKKLLASQRANLTAKAEIGMTYVDPFAVIHRNAEKWRNFKQRHPLSTKQRQLIVRYGGDPDSMTTEQGVQFLNAKFSMSEPQRRVLIRAGYSPEELEGVKKWEAKKLIDACIANHWKRPMQQPAEA